MVVGEEWWKAKSQNPKSSLLLRVGKLQKSNVQMVIMENTEDVERTHEMNGVSATKE